MKRVGYFFICAIGWSISGTVAAQIVPFDLTGNGGVGLLGANETPPIVGGGSGGEVGAGISLDLATNILAINVAWGSGNGFTNMTGDAIAGHVHGPTLSPAPTSFTQNANIRYGLSALPGWNPSATNGGFSGALNIMPGDVAGFLAGQFYINIHTDLHVSGEMRGYLVPVPEPGSLVLIGACISAVAVRRQRHLFLS